MQEELECGPGPHCLAMAQTRAEGSAAGQVQCYAVLGGPSGDTLLVLQLQRQARCRRFAASSHMQPSSCSDCQVVNGRLWLMTSYRPAEHPPLSHTIAASAHGCSTLGAVACSPDCQGCLQGVSYARCVLPDKARLLAADFFRGAQVALLLQSRDPPQRCLLALCALDKLTFSPKVLNGSYAGMQVAPQRQLHLGCIVCPPETWKAATLLPSCRGKRRRSCCSCRDSAAWAF